MTSASSAADLRTGSVWYKVTPTQTGIFALGTCSFLSPTAIEVFSSNLTGVNTGPGYGDMKAITFDSGSNSTCDFLLAGSYAAWVGEKGKTYYMQVASVEGGFPGTTATTTMEGFFLIPYIDKLSKTSGSTGNTVTITGQSLTSGGTPVVKFGSKTATIVGAPTATTIVVKVPSQSGHKGKFTVTVTAGANVSNKVSFTYK